MSKFTSLIARAPKRFSAVVAMVAAAIIIPTAVLAWGPDRPTFTLDHPAPYVTFNSITDNPVQGDERNFVQVKEADAANSTYSDSEALTPGKTYTMFVYYHNDAASNLNASGVGVAQGAYVKAALPAVVTKGSTDTKAVGYIGATNANPTQVWDDVNFSNASAGDVALRFVPGSAKIYNKGATNGATLNDSIVTSGAPIGYDALNGTVPGCNDYSGYVTFNFVADQSNFELTKQVRVAGTTTWSDSVNATPGTTVNYELTYKNTGTTEQNNVVLKDSLPAGLTYVAGSTYLKNVSNPTPKLLNDDLTTATGINIGNYAPNSVAYVMFSAKVNAAQAVTCGTNTLHNVATAVTNNGSKQDSADVVVTNKDCTPGTINVCQLSTKTIVNIKESDFDASKYSKDLSVCTPVTPPVTPPELPHTGMTENIVAVIGLGAIVASAAYYIASRRALRQ